MAEEQTKSKEEKTEKKGLSEREQKVENKVKLKKLSKKEAEKEVAKESVKEKTGYSAESMAAVGRDVLYAKDGFEKPDAKQAAEGMSRIKGNAVEGMLERMTDPQVAEDIVKAGLGAEHTSTGKAGLEAGAKTVLEKSREFGEGGRMEAMLAEAAMGKMGISREEAANMTPEHLKDLLNQYKNSGKQDTPRNQERTQEPTTRGNQPEPPIRPTQDAQKGTAKEGEQSAGLLKKITDKLSADR